jgi:hypothetical protein
VGGVNREAIADSARIIPGRININKVLRIACSLDKAGVLLALEEVI